MKISLVFLFVLSAHLSLAASDAKKCAKVALYSQQLLIWQNTSFRGLEIDPNGVIRSSGSTWVSKYLNNSKLTKFGFKDGAEIIFEKSPSFKISSVTNGTTKSILTDDCNLEQTIKNGKELLYDRKACLDLASLYRKMGMNTKNVLECGELINSLSKVIEVRNKELQESGLEISKIEYKNPLEVSGFVFSCGDQLSFEKIEDGVIKGTVLPFTIDMLNKAFSVLPSPNQSTEKKAPAVR